MQNSTITQNQVGLAGGGISNTGILTVQNSTISGNRANGHGGGIEANGTMTVQNSTITQNHANDNNDNSAAAAAFASARRSSPPCTTPSWPTTSEAAGRRLTQRRTTSIHVAAGVTASSTNNLIGTGGSAGLIDGINGNQVGVVDPMLGPLAITAGRRRRTRSSAGSPAMNAGNNAQAPGTTDQRDGSFPRVALGTVDIGAYEVQSGELVVDHRG